MGSCCEVMISTGCEVKVYTKREVLRFTGWDAAHFTGCEGVLSTVNKVALWFIPLEVLLCCAGCETVHKGSISAAAGERVVATEVLVVASVSAPSYAPLQVY